VKPDELALLVALTWLVESAVLVLLVRASTLRIVLVSLAVNLLTNPLANWAHQSTDVGFWPIECAVWAVEVPLFALLFRIPIAQALVASLLANGVTAAGSFLL
jgi:hypothetical protein